MKRLNQQGSALTYALIGLTILGGVSVTMFQKAQDNKTVEGALANTQYSRLFEKKVRTLLRDKVTCLKNFTNVGVVVNNLVDGQGREIYKAGDYYYGQAIKFGGMKTMPHPTTPAKKFLVEVSFSKAFGKDAQRQEQKIRFEIAAMPDIVNNLITGCQFDGSLPTNLDEIYETEIFKMCQGPGMVSRTGGHCIIEKPHNLLHKECPAGEFLTKISLVDNQIVADCAPVITQIGDNGTNPCLYGIKYTSNPGKFECLKLTDIVNQTSIPTPVGSQCRIDVELGKYVFKCSPGASVPGPSPTLTPSPTPTPQCFNNCFAAGFDCQYSQAAGGSTTLVTCSGVTQHCANGPAPASVAHMCLSPDNQQASCKPNGTQCDTVGGGCWLNSCSECCNSPLNFQPAGTGTTVGRCGMSISPSTPPYQCH